ncbi:MAG: hypothetical protein IPP74_09895 [Alphaproteobacteria bacterium]|nr:hypothetical protein [Alphaproteobacteria bacterium]
MNTFRSNIISIYAEKGKAWLDELPQLITAISSRPSNRTNGQKTGKILRMHLYLKNFIIRDRE